MRKFLLIYNPVSGNASFKKRLDEMICRFQKLGCMLIIYRTSKDLSTLSQYVLESGAKGIIVAGGDGTVHEVVNVIMRERISVPMAIIGSGTSNDFATYLDLVGDLEEYVERVLSHKTMRVDLGRIGEEYFINVASAGVMTNIAHEVDVRLKNVLGKMAYYLKGISELPKFRSVKFSIEADGKSHEAEGFLFVIANGGVVGSFNNVATRASINDGKLDLLLVKKCSLPELVALTAEIVAGKGISEKNVLYLQAKRFLITADAPLLSDVDGEKGPPLPLLVEVVPQAIEIFI